MQYPKEELMNYTILALTLGLLLLLSCTKDAEMPRTPIDTTEDTTEKISMNAAQIKICQEMDRRIKKSALWTMPDI
jgi:hypothetical protein